MHEFRKIIQEKMGGKNLNSPLPNQDHEQKLRNMQYQNDLLMERMQQLNEIMKKILDTSNELHSKQEKNLEKQVKNSASELKSVMEGLNYKIRLIQDSSTLANSFEKSIYHEMDGVLRDIKDLSTGYSSDSKKERDKALQGFSDRMDNFFKQLDYRVNQVEKQYKDRVQELENVTAALVEKQKRNVHFLENMKFIFVVATFVVIAVVLTRALLFGVWEGLYVKNIYEWESQWDWLKYTMWGLFAGGLAALAVHVYFLIKKTLYNKH